MNTKNKSKNRNLQLAKKAKNDEFYTQLRDIENELSHYKEQFKNKIVLCNCDDPYESNFFKYFALNFNHLGLKKLIATCYDGSPVAYTKFDLFSDNTSPERVKHPYKIEINEVDDYNKDGAVDLSDVEYLLRNKKNVLTLLKGNGDFSSEECTELLKQADIVVTNPPFSCYSDDTEVKTNHGWKLFADVDIKKDLILSINPDTKTIEYVKAVDKIVQPVNDELLLFKGHSKNLFVTKNHKMWAYAPTTNYVSRNKQYKIVKKGLIEASNVKKGYLLPTNGFNYNNDNLLSFKLPSVTQLEQYTRKEIKIPEKEIDLGDWLEFFGFYLADGCYRDHINIHGKRDYSIVIAQNIENDSYVRNLIKNIGFTCEVSRKSKNHSKCFNYSIYSKQLWTYLHQFGKSRDKFIPEEFLNLSPYYLNRLLTGYQNGDSNFDKDKKFIIYSSCSKKLMENIQEILLKIYGQLNQIQIVHSTYKNQPYVYYKIRHTFNRNHGQYTKYGIPKVVKYNGNVYCLQLERNHIMLVRREGTVSWCGNCFRQYVAQLIEYDKKFLIIGNKNAITYKEIFPLIKENKVWLGETHPEEFIQPDGKLAKLNGLTRWFTNLPTTKRNEFLTLYKKYNKKDYPKYDNYDAINVDKVSDIPMDYFECIGVPITFLDKYNPEQFEIIGDSRYHDNQNFADDINIINGKCLYRRILIKRR